MLIGITGGIGMGKTTVLRDFEELGGAVSDADQVAHSLYRPGCASFQRMVTRWGRSVLGCDGEIDRGAVAQIVFRDSDELAWLNGLLHPLIRSELRRLAAASTVPLYCAVPLLYESGWSDEMDAVVSVWCPPAVQHARLLSRGWSEEEIGRRVGSQLSADEKLHRSDYGIISDCSWSELHAQCACVHERLCVRLGMG